MNATPALAGITALALIALTSAGCEDTVSPQHPGTTKGKPTPAKTPADGAIRSKTTTIDKGLELRLEPVETDTRGRPVLAFRLTNVSDAALSVPNGKRIDGYGDRRSGLRLEIRDSRGRSCEPDPGAGGPAMMIEPGHFTTLQPKAGLTVRVGLGRYMVPPKVEGDQPANRLTMAHIGDKPGRFTAKVHWVAEELPRLGSMLDPAKARQGAREALERPSENVNPDPRQRPDVDSESDTSETPKKPATKALRWTGKTETLEQEIVVR